MKKIKKIAASIMAVAAIATSMAGISASAAMNYNTGYKYLYPSLGGSAKADVDFNPGTRYYTTTQYVSGGVTFVTAQFEATTAFSEIFSPVFTSYTYASGGVTSSDAGGTITSFVSTNYAYNGGSNDYCTFSL